MSRPMNVERKCFVCGKTSKQTVLASTNQFGAPDLDLRPPEMARSTMGWWIEECPRCGYVAHNLSNETTITKEWLKNNQYVSCDNRNFRYMLSEKFYKHYLITKTNGENRYAFFAALRAAWACDDARDDTNAIYCRKRALEMLPNVTAQNDEEQETFLLIRADLLRRTEQFKLLIQEYGGKTFSRELLNKIVEFQVKKAKQGDTDCYTVADVE